MSPCSDDPMGTKAKLSSNNESPFRASEPIVVEMV
jgi:hypothetical protein